jgi:hypothetical protein
MFVDSCSELFSKNVDDILENTWGNREVSMCPRDMLDNGNLDRRKVLVSEAAFL